jgi:L-ribulose-5-phosphate 3-epimerase UlaE
VTNVTGWPAGLPAGLNAGAKRGAAMHLKKTFATEEETSAIQIFL